MFEARAKSTELADQDTIAKFPQLHIVSPRVTALRLSLLWLVK